MFGVSVRFSGLVSKNAFGRSAAGSPSSPRGGAGASVRQLYVADKVVPAPLSVDSMSLFLRYKISLTARKQFEGAFSNHDLFSRKFEVAPVPSSA